MSGRRAIARWRRRARRILGLLAPAVVTVLALALAVAGCAGDDDRPGSTGGGVLDDDPVAAFCRELPDGDAARPFRVTADTALAGGGVGRALRQVSADGVERHAPPELASAADTYVRALRAADPPADPRADPALAPAVDAIDAWWRSHCEPTGTGR